MYTTLSKMVTPECTWVGRSGSVLGQLSLLTESDHGIYQIQGTYVPIAITPFSVIIGPLHHPRCLPKGQTVGISLETSNILNHKANPKVFLGTSFVVSSLSI